MAFIDVKNSVGKGGMNRFEDVLPVQILLNKFIIPGYLDYDVLATDGIAGKKTKQAIKAFQAVYLGFKTPDGRVDPKSPTSQTIDALNGPANQPKKGDPHESAVQSVVSTLRSSQINSVRFQMDGMSISSADFKNVADYFSGRRLQAYYDPALGNSAEYHHANDPESGGYMLMGFPKAVTALQKSIVVHEATHAVCDGWGKMMGNAQAEALAHLAQAVYYFEITSDYLRMTFAPTADVLHTAVDVARRMKSSGNRTVTASEVSELYARVVKLLNVTGDGGGVFLYNGF